MEAEKQNMSTSKSVGKSNDKGKGKSKNMSSKDIANILLAAMEDIKGDNPVCMDVREITDITDYMLVAAGSSSRHIKGICSRILEAAKQNNVEVLGVEGEDSKEWVLIDLNSVIAHVMSSEQRELYQLESLWSVPPESK